MTDKKRITDILKAYTKKHNIMASSVILEEYAEELVKQGVTMPIRCESCDYYIPKAILTDEYDNPLGYDGICDNCDKYTDKDDFCSCARLKEREG